MLATALGFIEERLSVYDKLVERDTERVSEEVTLVHDLRNDLRYLHDNYDVVQKKPKKGVRRS